MHMSALGLPGYHLHAAYAGDWQLSPTEVRTSCTWAVSLEATTPPHPRPWGLGLEVEEICVLGGGMCRAPASLGFLSVGGESGGNSCGKSPGLSPWLH